MFERGESSRAKLEDTPKRRWLFTLFCEDGQAVPEKLQDIKYMTYQKEKCPTSGILQYRGFIQLGKAVRVSYLRKWMPFAIWTWARGTTDEWIRHCSNEESRVEPPVVFGVPVEERSNKRRVMERFEADPEEMLLSDPSRYRRCKAMKTNLRFVAEYEFVHELRDWQRRVRELIDRDPDDRSIIWVYGPVGAEGKTVFCKTLVKDGWFYSNGGTAKDIMCQYFVDCERHVVFDIPRNQQKYVPYSVIEKMKERIIQSDKYEPVTVYCVNNVHVMVMANFLPDYNKISPDRVIVITC